MTTKQDLREFIDRVKQLGEFKVIDGADWNLEIGDLSYLAASSFGSPALLFDKIKNYKPGYRILSTPYGTYKRIALSLGLSLEGSGLELVKGIRDKLREPFEPVPPLEVKKGPILENVHKGDEVDLFEFPTPQWQPLDGGRYIGTGSTIITRDPDEGWVNFGCQRVQIHDKSTATIMFDQARHGRIIRDKYWARGQSCPVAVTCGGDPFHVFVASSRIPWGTSEYDYVGWWRKEPVEVIKGPTTGLPIPACAEIVLEGEIVPPETETRVEGPFSEWTGHYAPKRNEAAFRVKCILHRNDPIILGALPFLGPGILFWPGELIKAAMVWNEVDRLGPGVKGVWAPLEFGPCGAVVISLKQMHVAHAMQAALAASAYPTRNLQKFVIVVDEDVDPSDIGQVLFAMALRSEPEKYQIIKGIWGADLDPVLSPEKRAARDFTSSSVIILACKPYHWIKDFPASVKPDPEIQKRLKEKWRDLLK